MTKTKLLHFFTLLMLIIFSINIGNFYLITKDKAPSFDEINMKIASQIITSIKADTRKSPLIIQ